MPMFLGYALKMDFKLMIPIKLLLEALKGMLEYAHHHEGWQDDHPEYMEKSRSAIAKAEGN